MRYTVIWRPQALDVLADLRISSADRGSLNQTVETFDRLPRFAPDLQGEEF